MKPIEELGISLTPWKVESWQTADDAGVEVRSDAGEDVCQLPIWRDQQTRTANANILAASPDLYEALWDCCEEVNEREVPRCYACRRGADGHCMARGVCKVYRALAKASGEDVKAVYRDCINWSNGDHCAKFGSNGCPPDCPHYLKTSVIRVEKKRGEK